MSSSWRNEKIMQFIDAIRLRPCLWDVTKLDYKNRNVKKDEWTAIGLEFEISPEEAQKKFKNLRTYFKNEIKKEEKKQKSGSGASQESSWFAFKSMAFIRTIDEADPGKDSESQLEINENCDDETSPSTSRPQLQPAPLLPPSVRQKMKRTDKDKQYETACEVLELVKNKMSRKSLAFGDHVNEKLLTYSEFVRNQVEYKISTILYEADMGLYAGPSSHGNSSLCHNSPSPAFSHSPIPSPQAMEKHGIRLPCQDNNKCDTKSENEFNDDPWEEKYNGVTDTHGNTIHAHEIFFEVEPKLEPEDKMDEL